MSPYLFGAGIRIVGLRLDAGAALSSSWLRYLHSYCIRVMRPGLSPGDKTYKVTTRMREAANRILKGNSYKLILKEH